MTTASITPVQSYSRALSSIHARPYALSASSNSQAGTGCRPRLAHHTALELRLENLSQNDDGDDLPVLLPDNNELPLLIQLCRQLHATDI